MSEHGGDGRRAGRALAELLVAAMQEIAAGIRPANEVPA